MTTRTLWLSGLAILAVGVPGVLLVAAVPAPPEKSATVWEQETAAAAGWRNKAAATPDKAAGGNAVFAQDSVFTQPRGLIPRPGLYPTLPDGIVANLGGDKATIDYSLVVIGPFLTKRSAGILKHGEKIHLPPNTELACLRYAVVEADGTRLANATALWRRYPGPRLSSDHSSGHVLAVGADGSLWSWGKNNRWQLGYLIEDENGKTLLNQEMPRRVKRIREKVVEAVVASEYSLALVEDGGVYQFGADRRVKPGNLGDTLPQRIAELDGCNIISIFNYAGGGVAVSADGVVWGWGRLLQMNGPAKIIPLATYDAKGRIPLRLCYLPTLYDDEIGSVRDFPFFYADGSQGGNDAMLKPFAGILNGRKPVDCLTTLAAFTFVVLDDGSVWQRNLPRFKMPAGAAKPVQPFQVDLGGSSPARAGLNLSSYIMLCQDGRLWAGGRHPFGGLTHGKTDTAEPVPLVWPADRSPVVDVTAWYNEFIPASCFVLLCRDGSLWLSRPWHRKYLAGGRIDEPPGTDAQFYRCPDFKLPMEDKP
jgi:hypothetical protein